MKTTHSKKLSAQTRIEPKIYGSFDEKAPFLKLNENQIKELKKIESYQKMLDQKCLAISEQAKFLESLLDILFLNLIQWFYAQDIVQLIHSIREFHTWIAHVNEEVTKSDKELKSIQLAIAKSGFKKNPIKEFSEMVDRAIKLINQAENVANFFQPNIHFSVNDVKKHVSTPKHG